MTAGRVPQPRVLANFKPSKTERLKEKRTHKTAYERREGNSKMHKKAIQACPCCVCGAVAPSEPHHLKQGTGERGTSMRSTDKYLLPLCHEDHINGVEKVSSARETSWFKAHGIDEPLDLAAALYAASPDVAKMTKIIIAHRENAAEHKRLSEGHG